MPDLVFRHEIKACISMYIFMVYEVDIFMCLVSIAASVSHASIPCPFYLHPNKHRSIYNLPWSDLGPVSYREKLSRLAENIGTIAK